MKGIVKKIVSILLLFVIAGLVYACIKSIMQPINFNKQKDYREAIGIQKMKDLRTLQEAFKSVNGHFTASSDSLVDFYKNGKMEVQTPRNSERPTARSLLSRCSNFTSRDSTSFSHCQAWSL